MKVRLLFFTTILVLTFNRKAFCATRAETGTDLRDECRSVGIPVAQTDGQQVMNAMSCISYSQGVIDGWALAGGKLCQPAISLGDQAKVVRNYLEAHPEELYLRPAALVIKAISQAYPCK
jgi:hypothetical protein